jgi:ribosomal protein L29
MDMRRKLEERDNLIWELRSKLENERKSSKWAQSEKANKITKKNELEDLFLECVEEVRKDIARRRAMSATYSNKKPTMRKSVSTRSLGEGPSEPEVTKRD